MLDRVTITGADDSVKPSQLVELSQRYPFVEWGILLSRSSAGQPRYPTPSWISALQLAVRGHHHDVHLSLHVCGHWTRQLLLGFNEIPGWYWEGFGRVQLNFHRENARWDPAKLAEQMQALKHRQWIFQLDGEGGNEYFANINLMGEIDCVPLFDTSGGAGVVPREWPKAEERGADAELLYHGYAGGLGPRNLEEQLPLIHEAAGAARYWIDMETHVRSSDDRFFDLRKVEQCLAICAPRIAK